jgi:AcrR family transcriptional regulator
MKGMCRVKKYETNDKQSIKNQRVKSYFIQAAKEIILSEGVESLSVRKVADRAGYTFTTIYNYFKDLNDLLQEVKNVMIQDVMAYMQGSVPEKIYDLDDIKKLNRQYIEYYVQHPNVFSFFYSYRLHPNTEIRIESPDYGKLYLDTYRGFVEKGVINEAEVPVLAKTIIYTLHGLLALYFSDNGMTKDILYVELEKVTEYLLKGMNEV